MATVTSEDISTLPFVVSPLRWTAADMKSVSETFLGSGFSCRR